MPNSDPRDGFFYPTLTLIIYSYSILETLKRVLGSISFWILCLPKYPFSQLRGFSSLKGEKGLKRISLEMFSIPP